MTSKQLQKVLDKLWTSQTICERYSITAMTVGAWRSAGLPCIVIKGASRPSIRFIPKEAKSWIKANKNR